MQQPQPPNIQHQESRKNLEVEETKAFRLQVML